MALSPWVRTVAYCENDRYAQSVLLSRMASGELPLAPIWDDVQTLGLGNLGSARGIDIITGGFPCQNISATGDGTGLEGNKSRLFFEIMRLAGELRPRFIFLENSPAIAVRGLDRVLLELTALGYECRWTIVSAGELGAPHLRERFFLLANSDSDSGGHSGEKIQPRNGEVGFKSGPDAKHDGFALEATNAAGFGWGEGRPQSDARRGSGIGSDGRAVPIADATSKGLERWVDARPAWEAFALGGGGASWPSWVPQPAICRTDAGFPYRVDKLRGVGNACPPQQYREAFLRLSGIGG